MSDIVTHEIKVTNSYTISTATDNWSVSVEEGTERGVYIWAKGAGRLRIRGEFAFDAAKGLADALLLTLANVKVPEAKP